MTDYRHLLFFLIAVSFSSCIQPANLDLEEETPRLVIISNFSPLDSMEVVVSRTRPVLESGPAEYITDASVALYEGDKFIEQLSFYPGNEVLSVPPVYKSGFFVPAIGENYRLEVDAPGYEAVSASSSIPFGIELDTSSVNVDFTIEEQDSEFNLVEFNTSVRIQDDREEKNYYHLSFYQEGFFYKKDSNGDTIKTQFFSLPLRLDAADDNTPFIPYLEDRGILVSDEFFDRGVGRFDFTGSYLYEWRTKLLGDFVVELRCVSEEYYLYHTAVARQYQASLDPLSDPVILYSNVDKGEGIFGGYTTSFYSLAIDQ
jgi:hypothetical protein